MKIERESWWLVIGTVIPIFAASLPHPDHKHQEINFHAGLPMTMMYFLSLNFVGVCFVFASLCESCFGNDLKIEYHPSSRGSQQDELQELRHT